MSRLDKINKLLRLYENNPDRAEADSALRKAAELMRLQLDSPEEGLVVDKQRIADLERREQAVEVTCQGCGNKKPQHQKDCLTHQIEKRVGRASIAGCFGCSGIIIIWFISALIDLVIKIFG